MMNILVPYNYTALGLSQITKAVKAYGKSRVSFVCVYVPQWFALGARQNKDLAGAEDALVRHFKEFTSQPHLAHVKLQFGGVVATRLSFEKVLLEQKIDIILKGLTGKALLSMPMFSGGLETAIKRKFDVVFLENTEVLPRKAEEVLFLSNNYYPWVTYTTHVEEHANCNMHFRFIQTSEDLGGSVSDKEVEKSLRTIVSNPSSYERIIAPTTIQAVMNIINQHAWKTVYLEISPQRVGNYKTLINKIRQEADVLGINVKVVLPPVEEQLHVARLNA